MSNNHKASTYLDNIGLMSNPLIALNSYQATALRQALIEDASSYLYNGIISLSSSVKSIQNNNYGWSIVKLYYSTFYLARSMLSLHGICLFYIGTKPYIIEAISGDICARKNGATHKVIINLCKTMFGNHLMFSNNIDGDFPLEWLSKHRENQNYKYSSMSDPIIPVPLEFLSTNTLRGWINTFVNDDVGSYVYTKEYGCFAFPVKLLTSTLDEFIKRRITCQNIDSIRYSHIQKILSDSNGPFSVLVKKIHECCQ